MIQCMSIPTVKVQTVKQNKTYYLVYIEIYKLIQGRLLEIYKQLIQRRLLEIYKQLIQGRLLDIFSNIYCRECSDDFSKTIHDVWQTICSWQQTMDTKKYFSPVTTWMICLYKSYYGLFIGWMETHDFCCMFKHVYLLAFLNTLFAYK